MNHSTPGLPVHHQLPEFTQTHVHWVRWCHPTISSSVIPFSSCPQSFPASGSFQMNQLFTSDGQSIGVLGGGYWKGGWWACVKGFPGGSVVKKPPANARDMGSIPVSGRSSGEGKDNQFQCSCLENPMDREAWQSTRLQESWTGLSD